MECRIRNHDIMSSCSGFKFKILKDDKVIDVTNHEYDPQKNSVQFLSTPMESVEKGTYLSEVEILFDNGFGEPESYSHLQNNFVPEDLPKKTQ